MTEKHQDPARESRFLSPDSPPHIGTLIALTGVAALGMNLFLPSLPGMAEHFGVSAGVMGLSVGLYLLVNAILQFFIGPVSDKYGRRRVILAGMVAYLIATLVCIFAPNITVFLIFRMVQASIAVAMVLSRAVVRDTTPADQAGSKIAYVTMGMAIIPMIGPAIGGFLEQHYGWHANFWLLFAAGLAVFALAWFDLGETARPSDFTLAEQYGEVPELLKSPRFWGYTAATTFSSGAFFAFLGGAPFVASTVYGLEPQELGLYFAAPSVGYFFGNYASGRFSARLGINKMLLIGMIILVSALGMMLLLSVTGLQTLEFFFMLMIPVGLGNGMSIPNGVSGSLSVRPHLAGTASGVNGAMMLGGGAGLSALAGWLLQGGTTETPLVALMFVTVSAGLVSVLLVIRRERRLMGAL
ncbi:multidrug effflux MFS transporter [Rhodalgimonas zhirmunskyi]|uniref:Bcr/CflA family efflux transporter n=1 Tax=Rhodalgimonas zhirmunskyi TaxID=2964767 RepID=A0AAJ1U762_9RHOB|nr:multidrug effflux MFS transporter [Rhodoalgimonas zhirmunskyi]MDQ2092895.1 multidrug effflux MFS transporter [Rhodoalgimonas zhirmunskyi]